MADELVITDKRSSALQPSGPTLSPMQELQMQIVRTGDLEKLKELRAIEKEWRADQAKQSFIEAMAAFKSETIVILKDRENKQYSTTTKKAMYTSLGNLVQTVTPYLSRHALSVTWADPVFGTGDVKVICRVSHRDGHYEEVSFVCPFDSSGAKNPIQQRKSSITYARAITYEMALGLAATEDANRDDDGAAAGDAAEPMDQTAFASLLEKIEGSRNDAELKSAFTAANAAAVKVEDKAAIQSFARAKNAKYRELHGDDTHA